MASYLVTGGCGFIGSHLADALVSDGHRVRILDDLSTGKRENAPRAAEIVVGDVAEASTVRHALRGMDGCFHLAAIASVARSNEDWAGTHRVNLTGTINVFDAARAHGGSALPVVYISSAAVYGDSTQVPLAESAPTRPLTAYGADKLGCELHARVAATVHGVPVTGLRFFNIYGPRQDPSSPYSGVISIFTDRILSGRPVDIHGDGAQTRDFVFVADAVRFLRRAMRGPFKGAPVFNVCTGRATTVTALARIISDAARRPAELRHTPPRAGDVRLSVGDPSAAADALGLRAETRIEDGLRITVEAIAAEGG